MPSCWLSHSYARAHVPVQTLIASIYSVEQLIAGILAHNTYRGRIEAGSKHVLNYGCTFCVLHVVLCVRYGGVVMYHGIGEAVG